MCKEPKDVILEIKGDSKPEACKVKIEKNSKSVNWELSMSGPVHPYYDYHSEEEFQKAKLADALAKSTFAARRPHRTARVEF